jgi:enoyl-CoA hydratase/carnithine racemase
MNGAVATITLNDPARRNALGMAMFDAIQPLIASIAGHDEIHVVLLQGEGKSFCAGFDLAAAVDDAGHRSDTGDVSLMAEFINRLSRLNRSIRRLPQVVIVAVQGHALAGGCALLSACDCVVVAPDATLGYPVHRIGVSPAVTLPLLRLAMGDGAARALVMSGELIDGREAKRRGLATHLAESGDSLTAQARALCASLVTKGPKAIRATKAWLNELDGSLDDRRFDVTADASASLAAGDEAATLLREFWSRRGA